jgi:hypothetical protein
MAFTSEALDDLLSSLAPIGVANKVYREAVKGATVKINDKIALTLGSKQRKTIPVLRIVVEAITNKLFIERAIPQKLSFLIASLPNAAIRQPLDTSITMSAI